MTHILTDIGVIAAGLVALINAINLIETRQLNERRRHRRRIEAARAQFDVHTR